MSTAELVNIDPRGRRSPRRDSQHHTAAAAARMLLDEHRSSSGRCVRCDTPWPCTVAAKAMNQPFHDAVGEQGHAEH
ncbi:hypothetical protein [Kitasatospora cathayae]|uniref:4Fe-4S Wbl-type domain-containing protein n=1 Tax=Kitasatospora cathayae TaxID=3004092 RepID=A0ABY7Q9Y7_9ACTN|nr:hypothetical protein [Kitasatospora sp. HUAS 3-15]WBP89553.1 hypothetical protein O1G21_29390 [Kitasatospora sp. HUAS 3-15]